MDALGLGALRRRSPTLALAIGFLLVAAVGSVYLLRAADATGVGPGVPAVSGPPAAPQSGPEASRGPICEINPPDGQDAINAAVVACPDGTTVRFPAGRTYHQTAAISVVGRRNLMVDGNGSTFVSSAPNENQAGIYEARPNWQIVEGVDVTLRNMTIRGNLPQGPRGILPGNQYNAGIVIYGGDGIEVSDVSVTSVFGDFLVTSPSGFFHGMGALDGKIPTNVHVLRLHGEGSARQCVAVTAAEGFELRDSSLRDCYQNGVDIEPDVAGERVHDVHIVANSISAYRFAAIAVPTAYASGDVGTVEIRNNRTSPSDTCFPAVLLGGVQRNTNLLMDVVVAENRLETLNEGIKATYVGSGRLTANQITIKASRDLCGPPAAAPLRLVESPNLTVESNPSIGYGD